MPHSVGWSRVIDIAQRLPPLRSRAVHKQTKDLSFHSESLIRSATPRASARWRRTQRKCLLRASAFHKQAGSDGINPWTVADASDLPNNVAYSTESQSHSMPQRWSRALKKSTLATDLPSAAVGVLAAGVLSSTFIGTADAAAGKIRKERLFLFRFRFYSCYHLMICAAPSLQLCSMRTPNICTFLDLPSSFLPPSRSILHIRPAVHTTPILVPSSLRPGGLTIQSSRAERASWPP